MLGIGVPAPARFLTHAALHDIDLDCPDGHSRSTEPDGRDCTSGDECRLLLIGPLLLRPIWDNLRTVEQRAYGTFEALDSRSGHSRVVRRPGALTRDAGVPNRSLGPAEGASPLFKPAPICFEGGGPPLGGSKKGMGHR